MNNKLQGDKKQLEELEQNRKLNVKTSMMLAGNSGSKDMAIATDITVPHKSKSKKKKKKQIDEDDDSYRDYESEERKVTLEKQKEELNYFYGSRAFQLMKDLTRNEVKNYISVGEIAYDGNSEFKWIREYRRFIAKSIPDEISTTSASTKDYNVTEDYDKLKENEWWIRQKYKLMKTLKK